MSKHSNSSLKGEVFSRPSFGSTRSLPSQKTRKKSKLEEILERRRTSKGTVNEPLGQISAERNESITKLKEFGSINSSNHTAPEEAHKSVTFNLAAYHGNIPEVEISRHDLYKEAMYTAVHFLGKPSERFPATKEQLCVYVHEAFSTSVKEQEAIIEHVRKDAFPAVGVNFKIIRGDNLQIQNKPELHSQPNPYCVIDLEQQKESHQFAQSKNPLNKFFALAKKSPVIEVIPAHTRIQYYEEVPKNLKTQIQIRSRNPIWSENFQCLSLHPVSDSLTVEVWDYTADEFVEEAVEARLSSNDEVVGDILTKRLAQNTPDEFLGAYQTTVSNISCEGSHELFPLFRMTTNGKLFAGKILLTMWLVHVYRHGKHYAELTDQQAILECFWDWILHVEKLRKGDNWAGEISTEATCFLYQFALQIGISEKHHSEIRWSAYMKHRATLTAIDIPLKDFERALESINSSGSGKKPSLPGRLSTEGFPEIDSHKEVTTAKEKADRGVEIVQTVERHIYPVIVSHLKEDEELVTSALRNYARCVNILKNMDDVVSLKLVEGMLERAIRLAALNFYNEKFSERVYNSDEIERCQRVKFYVEFVNELNKLLSRCITKWYHDFWLDGKYENYLRNMYEEMGKMLSSELEHFCWEHMKPYNSNKKLHYILVESDSLEECVSKAFFSLYIATQKFVNAKEEIITEPEDLGTLMNYHKWFRPILVLWVGFAVIQGSEMIEKSVLIDTLSLDDYSTTSTSAVDAAFVLHQMVDFWEKIKWPDVSENYVLFHFIFEVICYYTVLYAKRKHEKLKQEKYYHETSGTETSFAVSDEICITLNNIEYVKEVLEEIPEKVKYHELIEELDTVCGVSSDTEKYKDGLKDTLHKTFENIEIVFEEFLMALSDKIRPEIKKLCKDCLSSLLKLKSTNNDDLLMVLDPLFAYTDKNIVTLSTHLLDMNFARILRLFWNITCEEIYEQAQTFDTKSVDVQAKFFSRILKMVAELEKFFMNDDGGLDENELSTAEYERLIYGATLFTYNTRDVIEKYYCKRADLQKFLDHQEKTSFVTLEVKATYSDKKLTVEILSARGLSPTKISLSFFGICENAKPPNPYVEIEILPKHRFPNYKSVCTKIKQKTHHPVFNEEFEWNLNPFLDGDKETIVAFTVRNYDPIRKDNFLGEAFVPLSKIPGASEHPLHQPMQLVLRMSRPNLEINVLKSRTWDVEAQAVYQKHMNNQVKIPKAEVTPSENETTNPNKI